MKQVQVEVKVSHAGPGGSYIQGDKAVMSESTARQLEKIGYVIISRTELKKRKAINKKGKESR